MDLKTKEAIEQEFQIKALRYTTAFIVDDEKAIDLDNHRINFVVSSDVIDRAGESVLAEGVYEAIHRKGEFKANPVCLIGHRHHLNTDKPAGIGNWDVTTAKLRKHHVEMVLQFDPELELGKEYWIAYKNKTMRAVSIGFRIKDYRVEEISNRRVLIITAMELVEISVCAVGMNQQALAKAKSLGLLPDVKIKERLTEKEIVELTSDVITKQLGDRLTAIEISIEELKDLFIPGSEDDFSTLGAKDNPSGSDDKQISAEQIAEALKQLTENN